MAQFLDNTFANDMIRQAAKWLCTYDVWCIVVNQLQHFTCQEPTLTGLIADEIQLVQKPFLPYRRILAGRSQKCLLAFQVLRWPVLRKASSDCDTQALPMRSVTFLALPRFCVLKILSS